MDGAQCDTVRMTSARKPCYPDAAIAREALAPDVGLGKVSETGGSTAETSAAIHLR
ncbi:hypothetical protein BRAS3809_1740001 [Bradyrhizobium sp. STM 3809]|nr:hypothetical protein BRAS3809_1740001 [Bradyrhizobium sp. STM 3809]